MIHRGDVYDVEWPGAGRHPAVVVTREVAIPVLRNVTVALVTSRVRGLRTEVPLGVDHGLARECVVNCDNLLTITKEALVAYRGSLGPVELKRLDAALTVALGIG